MEIVPEEASCSVEQVSRDGDALEISGSTALSAHTTLRVGGPAQRFVVARTERELIDEISAADAAGVPVLVLGGGSNVLVSDEGFPGVVVRVALTRIDADVSACGGAVVRVGAGENWDDFVAYTVEQEWGGAEALSGIPGSVGATPIQNVGAYGVEVEQLVYSVRTYDRQTGQARTFAAVDCGFAYRSSLFKREPGRYVVLSVTFQLTLASLSAPIRYAELARELGVEQGRRADARAVRETVLRIRGRKGMVLDDADHDTWSAGSFFTNPILSADDAGRLPADAPRFPTADGRVKTSAAWLIQHAGFERGHRVGEASLSTKHVLALTNRGRASADDIVALAREVRDGVQRAFGVTLVPEVNLVGVTL
ncbi:UDP-N-acetylmuramate dehydrogenase [Tessaracoccus caeni]|uniref:UDP-N-acetylmuramate dehydrogenase n=1 Tax=Tessaracoccus caeni TaxID=3031239 RepID=UPI003872D8C3